MGIYIYIYLYIISLSFSLSLSLSLYIYIYTCTYMYIYIYIYMYTHIHLSSHLWIEQWKKIPAGRRYPRLTYISTERDKSIDRQLTLYLSLGRSESGTRRNEPARSDSFRCRAFRTFIGSLRFASLRFGSVLHDLSVRFGSVLGRRRPRRPGRGRVMCMGHVYGYGRSAVTDSGRT